MCVLVPSSNLHIENLRENLHLETYVRLVATEPVRPVRCPGSHARSLSWVLFPPVWLRLRRVRSAWKSFTGVALDRHR